MAETAHTLAVFDFDDTLIEGDSFWTFLFFTAGHIRTALVVLESLVILIGRRLADKNDPAVVEYRTFIKARLIDRLLRGKTLAQLKPALDQTYHQQTWNPPMLEALRDHAAKGHHIVIASGALDVYLPHLVQDIPHNAIICTEITVEKDVIIGTMTKGNCVRQRKAELVAEYIAAHGPFDDSWGYGNFPHDVPMLNLMRQRVLV